MCLFPINADIPPDGGRPRPNPDGDITIPCGTCTECVTLRALHWSNRCRHEISLHQENCFITLTYNDETLPSHLTVKTEFQKFMLDLRRATKKKLSYIVSHEYGSQTFRPHHHAIIFGHNFKNQKFLKSTKSGEKIFTSPDLDNLWSNGYSSIGTANEKTAYYIASYALKGKKHEILLPCGEYAKVSDTMDSSKRPGIGLLYLEKNYKQLINSGTPLPRYYTKKLKSYPDLTDKQKKSLKKQNKLTLYKNMYDYFSLYEQNIKFKQRSDYEIFSKHKLDHVKKTTVNSEYRLSEDDQKQHNWMHKHLKNNVEHFNDKTRKNK